VIDRLSGISELRVIASSSSFKYRSTDTDPRVVSTALDVSALREQDTRLSILRDRRLAGLRSDPRFASLVERGGLQR
jgi:hypothetical protein